MGNIKLKQIFQKLLGKKRYTAVVLKEPPDMGPTRDWSGPEITLDPKNQPVIMSRLICELLSQAEENHAVSIEFQLLASRDEPKTRDCFSSKVSPARREGKGDVSIRYGTPESQKQQPNLPGYIWSSLVTSFPKFLSIESCQGVLIDPVTKEKWRFIFNKEANQISLNKIAC